MDITSVLNSAFPDIDAAFTDYIEGILNADEGDFKSPEDVEEAVGEILHEIAGEEIHENDIKRLCSFLFHAVKGDGEDNFIDNGQKVLNAPLCLGNITDSFGRETEDVTSIWMKQKEVASSVDPKKLEKAEAKLKQKQSRRGDQVDRPIGLFSNKEATAVQAITRRNFNLELKGANRCPDIRIENFDVSFADKTLLKSAHLTLVYGRRYGMVGRNGIGKSTLLKMISCGELKIPSHVSVLHVEQEVNGDDTIALDSVLECDVQRQQLLQEEKFITAQLNTERPASNDIQLASRLQEVYLELQHIEVDKAPAKASVILAGLGFTPQMQNTATREFSGGWRMRIALARALFSKPDLLLLDEPTNMLDMKAIIWLEGYLQAWESTLFAVSHDRRFLDAVSTDILHFHSQHIESYRGNYSTFIKTVTEKLKHQQREYEAQQQFRAHVQVFIDKFRHASPKKASLAQSKIKMLERLPELKPLEKETAVTFMFSNPEILNPPVLQLDDVTFYYAPGKPVLKNVDLSANMDSRICIVGDNGSGKTTLLKLLTGELNPTKGIRHSHRNLVIGYFTQHHVDQLNMNVSSLEFLARRFPGKSSEEYRRQLGCFGITGDLSLQSVASLSGGQKSRVAFTLLSMLNPHFLILDEPTNHLDVQTVEALGLALDNFQGGVILVSHDEQLIEMVCKELWVCKAGTVTIVPGGFAQYKKLVEAELSSQ